METRDLEKIFSDFQKERMADGISSDDEIVKTVFNQSRHHPMYKRECKYYIKQELNRLRREAREEKENQERLAKEKERMLKDPGFIAGAAEAKKRYDTDLGILNGTISREDIEREKEKEKRENLKKFGPLR